MGDSLNASTERLLQDFRSELDQIRANSRGASSYPTNGDTARALVRRVSQTAHGFFLGDYVAISEAGSFISADVSDPAKCHIIGMVVRTHGDDAFTVQTSGFTTVVPRGLGGVIVNGRKYFLNPAAPGTVQDSEPTDLLAYISAPVFIGYGAASGYIIPWRPMEHSQASVGFTDNSAGVAAAWPSVGSLFIGVLLTMKDGLPAVVTNSTPTPEDENLVMVTGFSADGGGALTSISCGSVGFFDLPGNPNQDNFTVYYADAAGDVTSDPDASVSRRAVYYSYSGGALYLFGPSVEPYKQGIQTLYDTNITVASLTDGQTLAYDLASKKWVARDPGTIALGTRVGLSVIGRAVNSSGVAADIQASTTGDVLHMGATTLVWSPLDTASYNNSSVTVAKMQDLAAISVLGRSAATSGVMAAITAATTGQLLTMGGTTLGWGQAITASYTDASVTTIKLADASVSTAKIIDANVTTVKIADANVTNAKLDDIVSASSAGSGSSVPVITWNAKGRITGVSTAAVSMALSGLSDVTITSVANLNFLRYSSGSSKWINYDLGRVTFTAGSPDQFALDGGSTASAGSVVGIGHASSRFVIGGSAPFDFILTGVIGSGTDKNARIRCISLTQVSFYDQATNAANGDEVMRWTTDTTANAANRLFDFKIPVKVSGTYLSLAGNPLYMTGSSGANITGTSSVITLTAGSGVTLGTGSLLNLAGGAIRMSGTTGASIGGTSTTINLTATGGTTVSNGLTVSAGGVTITGASATTTISGDTVDAPLYACAGVSGLAIQTISLAKLTVGGSNGSFTVRGGIVTAYSAPT